jgi:hypothetical protein
MKVPAWRHCHTTAKQELGNKGRKSMDQKLKDHWENLIRPLFEDADYFKVRGLGRDVKVEVAWALDTGDIVRPQKASKTLWIIIPWETIIEYQGKQERQESADEKIIQFIKKNLENFDPNHDKPRNVEPPIVELIVPKEII